MHILFITLSNIGDAIMTTPTLERLHQLYPAAVIDLVCDPRSRILFEHCPYGGDIFLKEKDKGKKGLWQLIRQLRIKRYDLIVDLRTDGLAYLLKAGQRLTKWQRKPYGPHAVEDMISIIDPINPQQIIPPPRLWLPAEAQQTADQLTACLPAGTWLAIGAGANWPPKVWDAKNFARTANRIDDRCDAVILLGGPGDRHYSQQVAEDLQTVSLDLTGKVDLLTTAAVISRCHLFIGNDSGLGHIASAVDVASLSVFGPGNPQRYHPWSKRNRWLRGSDDRLANLSIDEVVTQAQLLLDSTGKADDEAG